MGSTCLRDNDAYDFPWYSIWVSTELCKMWFPNHTMNHNTSNSQSWHDETQNAKSDTVPNIIKFTHNVLHSITP